MAELKLGPPMVKTFQIRTVSLCRHRSLAGFKPCAL